MTKRTPLSATSADCRVLKFARRVLQGRIIAGPLVRAACKRHLSDLKSGHKRGLVWSQESADRAIGYFEDVLKLNGGDYEGKPFLLAPWQAFIVGSLYGWYMDDGQRRFRVVYIETGKGSGKSPLVAGIGLYGLTADAEQRAEIYAAATKKDQAQILFRDAVAMVNQSPDLASRLVQSGRDEKVWNLFYANTNSFFKTISADEGASGPRPHIGLIDEVHEHKTATVIDMMIAGTKSRRRAMVIMITNSGSDKNTPCGQYHDYGADVCTGKAHDDRFFGFICSLDKGEDPLKDERCWPKVNPSLRYRLPGQREGIPGYAYLRAQVQGARGMPSKQAKVKRLNFCVWTQAESPWIDWEIWTAAEEPFPLKLLRNRRAVGGLDLSSTTDLTAFVLLFFPTIEDPCWRLMAYFWIPDHDLDAREKRDRVPYRAWIAERWLETTPGRAVSKLFVLKRLKRICEYFGGVEKIAYDRWRIEDLRQLMTDNNITLPPMEGFGQGYQSMGPAVDEFERRLLGAPELDSDESGEEQIPEQDADIERLMHDGNPVLTWNAANAVVTHDPANNRKVDKSKAIGRIDGIVASVMACGISGKGSQLGGPSIYESGVRI
ncbi:terminase large subunit [Comamonas sp. NyZ500]|uniref:terminase large subunit n=1 Tax=Comamonas sp. NyZ500 TaxID=2795732 RepID=UPI00192A9E8F|nr:terminase TerL endonuclease subunit [Comamonas sp. NyZ500]MBL5979056.1 terminase large subunit [Comamonas sp. NyZ500]